MVVSVTPNPVTQQAPDAMCTLLFHTSIERYLRNIHDPDRFTFDG